MKIIAVISLLILFSFPVLSQDFAAQTDANNEFAFDLYKYLSSPDENIFISPFSVSAAMAMTYEGARDKTRSEMSEVMHFAEKNELFNKNFSDIISRVKSSKEAEYFTFTIANSLWAQKDFDFLQSYFNTIKEYYNAPVETVDFKDDGNREKARKKINNWTAENTNDKIKDLLDENSIDQDTKLVLVNAVYFLASWDLAFKEDATKKGPFQGVNGEETKEFMSQSGRFSYAVQDSIQMLVLPYKEDKASMLIFLPDKSDQFNMLQKDFNYEFYKTMADSAELTNIELYLPKFKIEYKNDLAKTFYDAGMKRAFSDKAEFFGMACKGKENLRIDKIIHQTYIDVNEAGTEAAAATAVVMKRVTAVNPDDKIVFKADHPFIFMIRENTTGSILFMGQLVN